MVSRWNSLMGRLRSLVSIDNIGILLGLVGCIVVLAGYYSQYGKLDFSGILDTLWANIGSELIGIAVTILVVERIIRQRDADLDKERFLRDLRSSVSITSKRALEEYRDSGWLYDGSLHFKDFTGCSLQGADLRKASLADTNFLDADLRGCNLSLANLQGADLSSADLSSTQLSGANLQESNFLNANLQNSDLSMARLKGAACVNANLDCAILDNADLTDVQFQGAVNLTSAQLARASKLRGAAMTDGSRYDGRYSLKGDILDAVGLGIDPKSIIRMANYYGVSYEIYDAGQSSQNTNLISTP